MSTPGRPKLHLSGFTAGLLLLLPVLLQAQADACVPAEFDGQIRVQHIIDGDTIILTDDQRLRLIGIDTPELGNAQRAAEPLADKAREFLSTLLQQSGMELYLMFDHERRDAYGRMLAHLFLPDGTNVQALVLQRGLATPLTIPPNLGFLDCYRRHAGEARQHLRGLWQTPGYRTVEVSALDQGDRGYRVVRGRVTRIGDSSTSVWINLGRGFALRIVKADLEYFSDLDISGLNGNTVQASGELYQRNGQLRMRIRHPADLVVISD